MFYSIKNCYFKLLLSVILLSISITCIAQGAKKTKDTSVAKILVAARNYGDSIVVRWAPGNAVLWMHSNNKGYLFKRIVFIDNDQNKKTQIIAKDSFTVKVWSEKEWGEHFKQTNDTNLAVAAEFLYGHVNSKSMKSTKEGFGNIYDQYLEQQNKYGFALLLSDINFRVADGLGLRFVDKQKVNSSYSYLYVISSLADKKQVKSEPAYILVKGNSKLYKKDSFPAVSFIPGDRVIQLKWYNAIVNDKKFSAFLVEKSEDGKHFYKTSNLPFIGIESKNAPASKNKETNPPTVFSDSVKENYKKYYYRVTGIDAFGNYSIPSKVIIVKSIDLTPPVAAEITALKENGGKMKINWKKSLIEKDFKGFVIGRSDNFKGPFMPLTKTILAPGVNEFVDDSPLIYKPNFYIIATVDTAGNISRSSPKLGVINDSIPPGKPEGLTYTIDSMGHVALHWHWGKEPDVAGYLVYFSNSMAERFIPVTKGILADSVFYDSVQIKSLTKKIFYKIYAVDRAKNTSEASEVVTVVKPDIVPPLPAVISKFNVTDTSVYFEWNRSASEDRYIQIVYRKDSTNGGWKKIKELNANEWFYSDFSVQSACQYYYAIETLDSNYNSSGKSFPLQVYVYKVLTFPALTNLKVGLANSENKIIVSWDKPPQKVSRYLIYKTLNNSVLELVSSFEANNETSYEYTCSEKGAYTFSVKAIYESGKHSILATSDAVFIK